MMMYGRPPCNMMILSVGVRKMGARTEVYIVPETTSAVPLLGEARWIPSTSSDLKCRHKSLIINYQLPGHRPVYACRY